MAEFFNITHPLFREKGLSQDKRLLPELDPANLRIDGRSFSDFLDFVYKLSGQVIFYDDYMTVSDWKVFFENSTPFLAARIEHLDTEKLKSQLAQFSEQVDDQPQPELLGRLVRFIFLDLIMQVHDLQKNFSGQPSGFSKMIDFQISGMLRDNLKEFIMLVNGASKWYGIEKPGFMAFQKIEIWDIDIVDLFSMNEAFRNVPGGSSARIKNLKDSLVAIGEKFIQSLNRLKSKASSFFNEILNQTEAEKQKNHEPHLGLMFSFLELFEQFQTHLNKLSESHLSFFFDKVLAINKRELTPDKAHLTLELQQFVKDKYLKKGLEFKNGKDLNGLDIIYRLEHDIVLDKTQVASLKTLYLNHLTGNLIGSEEQIFVEGMYITTVANSADGTGEKPLKEEPKSWYTLGSKDSKYLVPPQNPEDKALPLPHAHGRLGWVFASSILLLKEGKREIELTVKCKFSDDLTGEEIAGLDSDIGNIASDLFIINLSGEEEWIPVTPAELTFQIDSDTRTLEIFMKIKLSDEIPAISFYNPEVLGEHFGTTKPVIKVELSKEKKIRLNLDENPENCLLERPNTTKEILVSPYHFFRHLIVDTVDIGVNVCEIRNLIVQNDENLQDINGLIYPFGVRPSAEIHLVKQESTTTPTETASVTPTETETLTVTSTDTPTETSTVTPTDTSTEKPVAEEKGSNFYIGSPEVFNKNWDSIVVNINWKDKPEVFKDYYIGYSDVTRNIIDIEEDNFEMEVSILEDLSWKKENTGLRKLFHSDSDGFQCKDPKTTYQQRVIFNRNAFSLKEEGFEIDSRPVDQLDINTRNGFMRLRLKGQDFQHNRYPFILSRQMMAFGKLPEIVFGAVYVYVNENSEEVVTPADSSENIDNIKSKLKVISLPEVFRQVEDIQSMVTNIPGLNDPEQASTGVPDAKSLYTYTQYVMVEVKKAADNSDVGADLENIKLEILAGINDNVKIEKFETELQDILGNYNDLISAINADVSDFETLKAKYTTTFISGLIEPLFNQLKSKLTTNSGGLFKKPHDDILKAYKDDLNDLQTTIETTIDGLTDVPAGFKKAIIDAYEASKGQHIIDFTTTLDNAFNDLGIQLTSNLNQLLSNSSQAIFNSLDPDLNKEITDIKNTISNSTFEAEFNTQIEAIFTTLHTDLTAIVNSAFETEIGDNKYLKIDKDVLEKIIEIIKGTATDAEALPYKDMTIKPEDNGFITGFEKLGINDRLDYIKTYLTNTIVSNHNLKNSGAVIPNEPYTPVIKDLSLDYSASAKKEDVELIHLYPYENTFKQEPLEEDATLLPTFEDEGALYIGLKDATPGNNVHLLFQLAEATAETESNPADILWKYLKNNTWETLQEDFHILSDDTQGLTRSGIVKIGLPEDLNKETENTIMPTGFHWLKVSARENTQSVCETINLHTQSVKVSYIPNEKNNRDTLETPAEGISKLLAADSEVKAIVQPYASFGGKQAELSNNYYKRVSEQLMHKGRGIGKSDHERLVLDSFPEIYKVKCLNHSFGLSSVKYRSDLEFAPGFITIAIIPDLKQLKTSNSTGPKAPASLLNQIEDTVKATASPFARIKVLNPRYEKVNVSGSIYLREGKPETFFKKKIREDLLNFLSPWRTGNQQAFDFGKTVSRSDIIHFIENLEYVDYICNLSIWHEADSAPETPKSQEEIISPKTARSILGAGMIDIKTNRFSSQTSDTQHKACSDQVTIYSAKCKA